MFYHLDCPAVAKHLQLLRRTAFPLVPLGYGLKPRTLGRCQSANAVAWLLDERHSVGVRPFVARGKQG